MSQKIIGKNTFVGRGLQTVTDPFNKNSYKNAIQPWKDAFNPQSAPVAPEAPGSTLTPYKYTSALGIKRPPKSVGVYASPSGQLLAPNAKAGAGTGLSIG